MKQVITDIKKLATEIVGDGKSPNKYFVTIAYGWYQPSNHDLDMIQVDKSLDSVTVMFNNRQDATDFFDSVPFNTYGLDTVTPETIGQTILEDRKTGVIAERRLLQRNSGSFTVEFI